MSPHSLPPDAVMDRYVLSKNERVLAGLQSQRGRQKPPPPPPGSGSSAFINALCQELRCLLWAYSKNNGGCVWVPFSGSHSL